MKNFYILISIVFTHITLLYGQKGTLSGKIVDTKTGEALIGVAAMIENSNPPIGAISDIDGNFLIKGLESGTHNVVFKYIGYATKTIKNVKVRPNEVTNLDITLEEENTALKEVEIVAEARRETQSAIFIMQKNSTVIQSGISSEDIKRSPDRSSSEVIRRVSGATIQDGKFAVIRGLADRYNMALLNSTLLPSTEPDRKAFAFDVFPSNVMDNIIIMKTGQPDLPSEWAGGLIQLNTRDVPEKNFFNVTYGISFTEQTTFRPYVNYKGSSTDFLGIDRKTRSLGKNFPNILEFQFNTPDSVRQQYGREIMGRNSWDTIRHALAYPNQSLQLSGGFSTKKTNFTLGGVAALTYSNSLRFIEGTRSRIDGDGTPYLEFFDKTHNNSVTTAAMGNLSLIIKNKHRLSWKNIYTINADDNTVLREGFSYFSTVEVRRTNLEFTSSRVFSSNLSGDHAFGKNDMKIRW
ncbi:MAG: TonB-dependent receptor, partial [Chitinophagales bacterium]|nr:TonB-dependent receptor [Chitinophagales bacterium]